MRPPEPNEPVAITIPTKNRPGYLTALLASLAHQSYPHWMLVLNDQSESPCQTVNVINDLLRGIQTLGHEVRIISRGQGWERHQKTMEAVPEHIEFIVRIDDDVVLRPNYLELLLEPFRLLSHTKLAAVGGTIAEPQLAPRDLELCLMRPDWLPQAKEPTWRLQGHPYHQSEVLEVESLLGHSLCYRRSAAMEVGGWAVSGYSAQAHREESDMCARWRAAGYTLVVTTEARAWHLYSPDGGSRQVKKSDAGVHLVSDPAFLTQDEELFRSRLSQLSWPSPELRRYSLLELRRGRSVSRSMRSWWGWLKFQHLRWRSWLSRLIR
ncbi:glycosyltransferase [bacterium]|nr:glycosyltransferase [bacterium]